MAEKVHHVVCVGSSFAAGPGIAPIVNLQARRSGNNFAHQVARVLGADLTDLSVSGATLYNLLDEPQTFSRGKSISPQIEGIPSNADLVLVTAGGNDMSYTNNMIHQSIQASWVLWLFSFVMPSLPLFGKETNSLQQITQRLSKVADDIHRKAPKARVLLVEYLALLGRDNSAANQLGFTAEQTKIHKQKADTLSEAYYATAKPRSDWCQVVPMHNISQAHTIGSAEPWVEDFSIFHTLILRKAPFHPNLAGMNAIAEQIMIHIKKTR